jgi:NCS1 family nucleobase:cation symporter-1
MITAVLGVLMAPWYLYNNLGQYIFTWLIGYSALLGPIAGIMLCDYYFIRRTSLNVDALYDEKGEYSYNGSGWNWRALAAFAIAVAPNLPGFLNAATNRTHALAAAPNSTVVPLFPEIFDTIYGFAWFVGLFIGAIVYLVLMPRTAASQPAGVPTHPRS